FSAFALGYAFAQIPTGWFADRFGPRVALASLVIAWSLFTALTGTVHRLWPLLAIRFLFGAAEAGAFPGAARAFYNSLPPGDRGRANGIIFSGSRIGAAIAFPLMAWLLARWNWRSAFFLLAIPGLIWAALWAIFFRDYPSGRKPPDAVPEEGGQTFRSILRSPKMWRAMAQYTASNFTFFLCLTWMLPYLQERYRLSPAEAAGYSAIPLLCGAVAEWLSGFSVDLLYRHGHVQWSRRLPAIAGFTLAAFGMLALTRMHEPASAVACFAIAAFGIEMTISPSWAYCIDVGGKLSGAVSGAMNMVGSFAAFVSAMAFPYLNHLTGSASAYFTIAALLNLSAAICWFGMRPIQPLRSLAVEPFA
ncbi:MAG: MFS transporter, partial [Acidobacteriota bacterium]|nr:MFS transporter [Acidobacteriota bacterium]